MASLIPKPAHIKRLVACALRTDQEKKPSHGETKCRDTASVWRPQGTHYLVLSGSMEIPFEYEHGVRGAHPTGLVTDNTREFSRIPGLKLENWLE